LLKNTEILNMPVLHKITHLSELSEIIKSKSGYSMTIGVFDGIHLGHQFLINETIKIAKNHNHNSCLISFSNSPYHFLTKKNDSNNYLSTKYEKTNILSNYKIDDIFFIEFNDEIANTKAYDFLAYLNTSSNLKSLIIGPDFSLGKNKEGNINYLNKMQNTFDYKLHVADPYINQNQIVSSTLIKKLIEQKQIIKANQCLGYFYNLTGKVIKGENRGKDLNMPTANLLIDQKKFIPPEGIYACKVKYGKKKYTGALSIGKNPTFGNNNPLSIEVHIVDFSKSLYNETLTIEIHKHIRDQITFSDIIKLKEQMQKDLIDIKKNFDNE